MTPCLARSRLAAGHPGCLGRDRAALAPATPVRRQVDQARVEGRPQAAARQAAAPVVATHQAAAAEDDGHHRAGRGGEPHLEGEHARRQPRAADQDRGGDRRTAASASGLAPSSTTSGLGNRANKPAGCAQYAETDSEVAHSNAARPAGTKLPWPPVPGQPFPKCLPPVNRNVTAAEQDGGRIAQRLTTCPASRQEPDGKRHEDRESGEHGEREEGQHRGGDDVRGEQRCLGRPWERRHRLPVDDELGPERRGDREEDREYAAERPEARADLPVAHLRGHCTDAGRGQRAAGQPGSGEPGHEPAAGDVEVAPGRPRPLLDVGR